MVNLMVDFTTLMLRSWESRIENEAGIANIKIDEDLRSLSADILSRACFGSNYSQGEEIFLKLNNLKGNVGVPGFRYGNISDPFIIITMARRLLTLKISVCHL